MLTVMVVAIGCIVFTCLVLELKSPLERLLGVLIGGTFGAALGLMIGMTVGSNVPSSQWVDPQRTRLVGLGDYGQSQLFVLRSPTSKSWIVVREKNPNQYKILYIRIGKDIVDFQETKNPGDAFLVVYKPKLTGWRYWWAFPSGIRRYEVYLPKEALDRQATLEI